MGSPERELRCPCGEVLWARRAGQWTLRTAMMKLDEHGQVLVRCPAPGCRQDLLVPFLHADPIPEPPPPRRRRLVLRMGQLDRLP